MKTWIKLFPIFLCFLLTGCNFFFAASSSDESLSNIMICNKLNKLRCEESRQIFEPGTPVIYLTATINHPTPGDKVKIEWIFLGNSNVAYQNFEQNIVVITDKMEDLLQFNVQKPQQNNWPPGKYQVELIINDGQVYKKNFEIKQ